MSPTGPGFFPTTTGAKWVYQHFNRYLVNPAEAVDVVTGVERKGRETVVSVGWQNGDRAVPGYKGAVGETGLFLLQRWGKRFDPRYACSSFHTCQVLEWAGPAPDRYGQLCSATSLVCGDREPL